MLRYTAERLMASFTGIEIAVVFEICPGVFGRLSLDGIGMSVMLGNHGGEMLYWGKRIKMNHRPVSRSR